MLQFGSSHVGWFPCFSWVSGAGAAGGSCFQVLSEWNSLHQPVLAEIGSVLSNENGLVWPVLSGQLGIKDSNKGELELMILYEQFFRARWELQIQTGQTSSRWRRELKTQTRMSYSSWPCMSISFQGGGNERFKRGRVQGD